MKLHVTASAYRDFIDAGHTDAEWEAYRLAQNRKSKERSEITIAHLWQTKGIPGNDAANLFRSQGIPVPPKFQKMLQHNDTTVSRTSVEARGATRTEAKALHLFVSTHMLRILELPK